jgi:hypothetical protein
MLSSKTSDSGCSKHAWICPVIPGLLLTYVAALETLIDKMSDRNYVGVPV